uniref:Protein kinase domain-containing protein n=1 Tax=Nymphaea colorata TaxID=210225 RepID=A0A5K1HH57_9MAGN|nr:unnamed protein product [Nymphaea colorata]
MKYYPYLTRAIKRIKKKFVKSPADIINEYTILTSFDHPQIIKIYETFEDEESFFIVTEYNIFDLATAKGDNSLPD